MALAIPTSLAYGLVSDPHRWKTFLKALIITICAETLQLLQI